MKSKTSNDLSVGRGVMCGIKASLFIPVHFCCYNRIPETEAFIMDRNLLANSFGGWEVQDQGVGVWQWPSCWLIPCGGQESNRRQKSRFAASSQFYDGHESICKGRALVTSAPHLGPTCYPAALEGASSLCCLWDTFEPQQIVWKEGK
jgi:hypothetical protein